MLKTVWITVIFNLTDNPSKTDYILKTDLIDECNYNDVEDLLKTIKESVVEFLNNIERLEVLNN